MWRNRYGLPRNLLMNIIKKNRTSLFSDREVFSDHMQI